MTNREAHEEAAGMGLDDSFFIFNNIDPDAEYVECSGNDPEVKECECNCGYTCGGPGYCELDIIECIEKHYKKNCGHDFSGPGMEIENGWTATCKHCGMTAIDHDMMNGI